MHVFTNVFRKDIKEAAEACRKKSNFTQERMAEALRISARSYNNLKREKNSLSGPALICLMFLIADDEILAFIHNMRGLVIKAEQTEKTV